MPKFVTVKSTLGDNPKYFALVQHTQTIKRKEAYDWLAEKTGFRAPVIMAAFKALAEAIKSNQGKGNQSVLDNITAFRNVVKGAFDTANGPWVKGKNYLLVQSIEANDFKAALVGIIPENNTAGANPIINTVMDETSGIYDQLERNSIFSIAGSDLGPDTTKSDEYVALVAANGTETRCEVTYSDLGNVKAKFTAEIPNGTYTLKVYTRSGMGEEYGVKVASRIVRVGVEG